MTIPRIMFLFMLFSWSIITYGQKRNTLDRLKADIIDSLIANLVTYQEGSGLAISITQNNEMVYANTYGQKNVLSGEHITENSIFHFASISKTFVSSAILKLYAEKKLNLSDPITKYIKNKSVADSVFSKITIQHLLNHTSGIAGIEDHHWDRPKFSTNALKSYVSTRPIKILSPPGIQFRYTDIGYELLGYVIEKVSKVSFEEYIQVTFLSPLEMHHTTFLKKKFNESQYAMPHVYDYDSCKIKLSPIYPYNREHAPSSTLQSTAVDFSNYAIFHLNKGTFKNKELLNKDLYKILWDTTATVNWSEEYKFYGAGWFIGTLKGHKIIHHSGSDNGFRTNFILLPEENISITIAANYYQARVLDLGSQIAMLLVQKDYQPEYISDDLSEFTGTYCKDSNCVEVVINEKNKLSIVNHQEIDCLVPASYKGIFIGKYQNGNQVKPYYDKSNIWLQKILTPEGKITCELRIGKDQFKKQFIK